jgi:protein ImuB
MTGQGVLAAPRRHLALHLPRWATDCLKRADPALAASQRPFALWEKQKGAMKLVALDLKASAEGLFTGQNLSDAKALVTNLELREIDRVFVEQVFADFADWHSNASPMVAVHNAQSAWGDLILDVTGVSHLFGGEERMLQVLTERLEALGFTVNGAIGPNIGVAWALAHYSSAAVVNDNVMEILARLPVAALRLEEAQIEGLKHLGLKQIGQLYSRDRRSLQARFGASLLLRLDQALGYVEERLTPRLPLAEHYVERRYPEPIGLIDDVLMTTRDLALQLAARLEREGLGAQAFHLFLYRVDHKVMTLSVNAARGTRDPVHIARLFAYRAERLQGEYDAGFGIDMIRLAASSVSPLSETQIGAFATDNGAASLDQLYDRMTSRLGPLAVVRNSFVNTHIPERAVKLEPVIAAPQNRPALLPVAAPRPLRLLPQPEPITVSLAEVPDGPPPNMVWRRVTYRFVRSSGPERISAEWWLSRSKLKLTVETVETAEHSDTPERYYEEGETARDYFIAEDDGGRRFWIFRQGLFGVAQTPKWFLHGFFS